MARSIYCYDCKVIKENPSNGYCRECNRKRDKEWRLKTGRTVKNQTGLCPCGAERASYNPAYCVDCAWKQKKRWIEENGLTSEQVKRINDGQKRRYRERMGEKVVSMAPEHIEARRKYHDDSPESVKNKMKIQVRALTRSYIKVGRLKKQPCEICGTDKAIEAHHDDYAQPMNIRWLCKKHHEEHHHNQIKRILSCQ